MCGLYSTVKPMPALRIDFKILTEIIPIEGFVFQYQWGNKIY